LEIRQSERKYGEKESCAKGWWGTEQAKEYGGIRHTSRKRLRWDPAMTGKKGGRGWELKRAFNILV